MDFNTKKYFVENSDALTEAEKIQFARALVELERKGVIEFRDGQWGLAAGVETEETPAGPVARFQEEAMNCDNCKKPIATGQARVFKFDGHEDRTYCARCADEIPPVNYSGTTACQNCGAFMDCAQCADPRVAEEIHRLLWYSDDDPDEHHGVHLCSTICEKDWSGEWGDEEADYYEETQDDLYDEFVNMNGREPNDEEMAEIDRQAVEAVKQRFDLEEKQQ